jgi:glyoxylase-like metal-dependent hydrolase (beta-lactamase superfamily II)
VTPGVVTLEPGLHRLGGMVELDGRVHFYPPAWRGWAPSNCYLLTAELGTMLVDTGFPAHEAQLLAQLGALSGTRPLSVVALRAADYSSLGNGAAVVSALPVRRFYCSLSADALIGFPPAVEPPPEAADTSYIDDAVDWVRCDVGDQLPVCADDPGAGTVEVVSAPLRKVGSARWLYDARTKTLFTSDSFCHAICTDPRDAPVLDDSSVVPAAQDVREQLLASFDWLSLANGGPRDAVDAIFRECDVVRIVPAHGRVLEGREVVRRHVDVFLHVLDGLS